MSGRTRVLGVVALAVVMIPASSCRTAAVGSRCVGTGFGVNGRWVMVCRNHHWNRWATSTQVAALLARLHEGPSADGLQVEHIIVRNGARQLPTTVYLPSTPGPWPLVVFAHGYNSTPARYDPMLRTWARAGFEVAAPASPGQAAGLGPLNRAGLDNQPGDLSATITTMISNGSAIQGRIAVVGHSDGGSAVAAMALTREHHDPRIAAYLVLAGALGGLRGSDGPINDGPLLAMVGDADEYGNRSQTRRVYDTAQAPRAFVASPGGRHIDPFINSSAQGATVRAEIVDFLQGALNNAGWDRLREDAARGGLPLLTDGLPDAVPIATTTTTTQTTTTTAPATPDTSTTTLP